MSRKLLSELDIWSPRILFEVISIGLGKEQWRTAFAGSTLGGAPGKGELPSFLFAQCPGAGFTARLQWKWTLLGRELAHGSWENKGSFLSPMFSFYFFIRNFSFSHGCSMLKFPDQGSNPRHSSIRGLASARSRQLAPGHRLLPAGTIHSVDFGEHLVCVRPGRGAGDGDATLNEADGLPVHGVHNLWGREAFRIYG